MRQISPTPEMKQSKHMLPPSPPTSLQSTNFTLVDILKEEKHRPCLSLDDNLETLDVTTPPGDPAPEELITYLDLRQIPEAVEFAWKTGRLPNWILNFSSVRILRASHMGLTVVDEWLALLSKLEVLILDQNQISTWPVHLTKLPHLKTVFLDGNPCLERMFAKSLSFRTAFFGNLAQRPQKTQSLRFSQGLHCGGIYGLTTPREDDLLTPLDPCPLQERRLNKSLCPIHEAFDVPQAMLVKPPTVDVSFEVTRGSQLMLDLFRDINILLGKQSLSDAAWGLACLTGLPVNAGSLEMHIQQLKLHEGLYISHLAEAIRLFFHRQIRPSIAMRLQHLFSSFPSLYLFHSKTCLSFIKSIQQSLQQEPRTVPPDVLAGVRALCREYADCGTQFSVGSTLLFNWSRDSGREGGCTADRKFCRWLEKQERNSIHTLPSTQSYLALPMSRLLEYYEFFRILARQVPEYAEVADLVRHTRDHALTQVQNARRRLQQTALAKNYGVSAHQFSDYHWDALLDVRSRAYFDRPSYDPVTVDIVDGREGKRLTHSVVKEIFSPGERQLRIIMCGRLLQIWDHQLTSHISTISIEDFEASTENGPEARVRIVFRSVDETCVCDLNGYHTVENFSGDAATAFVTAVQLQSVPICCSESVCEGDGTSECASSFAGPSGPQSSSCLAPIGSDATQSQVFLNFDFSSAEDLLGLLMGVPDAQLKPPGPEHPR